MLDPRLLFPVCHLQLRMLDGRDPSELLEELKGFRSKQVHPRNADTILSTVHKAKVRVRFSAAQLDALVY